MGTLSAMPLGPPFVDAVTAATLVADGATVLDARGRAAYLAGHVPGAVRVDWRATTAGGATSGTLAPPEIVAAAYASFGVDDDRPVLVVGAWREGWGEEGRLAWDLTYLGHPAVHVLEGGMDAWRGRREHLPPAPRAGRFTPRPRPALRISTAALAASLASPAKPVVLDVREPDEFAGARKYGEARGGHVPGAVSVPWHGLLSSAPDLPRDTPIVVYCTGGVRSGMAWAALTAHGFTAVSNDDASWWAWARAVP